MLCIVNYKKTYGSVLVLQTAQLELAAGIYWLKGENGAGKTTFLKSISGLIPFEGDIDVNGINLRKQRRLYTQDVSFAEAEPIYPGFLTGEELLKFYLDTKGGNSGNAMEIAEALRIATHLKNKVGTYSSGMVKKLSLLLCFSGNPKLLLLDEPFVTLDADAVEVLRTLIGEASKNASFIISSHQTLSLSLPFQALHIRQQTIEQAFYAAGA